jgi:hypothetical protein
MKVEKDAKLVEIFVNSTDQWHTSRLLELSENYPVRIDIVDIAERIELLLVDLEEMIGEGLVTVSDVHIVRYLRDPKSRPDGVGATAARPGTLHKLKSKGRPATDTSSRPSSRHLQEDKKVYDYL